MLNYSNVITKENSYSGIQMKEIRPVMKLSIRGKIIPRSKNDRD